MDGPGREICSLLSSFFLLFFFFFGSPVVSVASLLLSTLHLVFRVGQQPTDRAAGQTKVSFSFFLFLISGTLISQAKEFVKDGLSPPHPNSIQRR